MAKQFFCTDKEPAAMTQYGPVHGIQFDGIYTFKGIKYAKAKRFQPPQAPDVWTQPRDCYCYGYECPKMQEHSFATALYLPRTYWPSDEDCHYLNVWTPSLNNAAKKPVMVWLHGGGYAVGSGNAHTATEGSRLSKYGDVVVVTLNHRLNWLGYMDLSGFGEKYENSVNAGIADLVFALQWVRDNIEQFGGDPGNVTLFGQSGGGMKIRDLMQAPAADGLFHRGIVQSGVADNGPDRTPEQWRAFVLALLAQLGLGESQVEQLETLPYETVSAAISALPKEFRAGLMSFRPQKNHWLLGDAREAGLTERGKKIDLIVGTAFAEFHVPKTLDHKAEMTWAEAAREAEAVYGAEYAGDILRLYRQAYPEKLPFDALYLDSYFRKPTLDFMDVLSRESRANVYNYVMAFDVPISAGLPMRHSMDNPYVFRTTELVPACNGAETQRLEEEVSGAWIAFARTGDPNHDGLPQWTRYTRESPGTMVFASPSGMRTGYDRQLAALVFGRHRTRAGE